MTLISDILFRYNSMLYTKTVVNNDPYFRPSLFTMGAK